MTNGSRPIIAITGAGGFLGSALVDHCLKLGWEVIALVRQPAQYTPRAHVRYEAYDLKLPIKTGLLQGVNYVVHAAYAKSDKRHPEAFRVNSQAAENLLAASRANKLQKNIFVSSMSAHNQAISVYGRQKLHIESLFNGVDDVNLRPGLIVGDGGIVKNMAIFMRSKHVVPVIGGGKQPLQIIAIGDLLTAIEHAINRDVHGTLIVATSQIYTYKDFYKALAKRLKTPVLFISVPFQLILLAFRIISVLHIPLGVNEDNLWGLKMLRAVDNKMDLQKLDIKPVTLDIALQKTHLTA